MHACRGPVVRAGASFGQVLCWEKKNGPLLPPCLFVFSTKPYSPAITQYN